MKANGKMITCDRCGQTVFCKTTGEGERDGGYTRWNTFEEAEGWTYEYKIGDLCPQCTEEYKKLIEEFKRKQEVFLKGES